MSGGVISMIPNAIGAKQKEDAQKAEFGRLEDERKSALAMGDALKWTPEMVSKSLGSYQRSKSPVADAFLGSFLSGNNDQAIQSTRAGAPRMQAAAKASFDQQYGGWDKLRQQDAEMRDAQPWKLKDIAGVEKFDESKVPSEVPYLDKDQAAALKEQGFDFSGGKVGGKVAGMLGLLGIKDFKTRGGQGQQLLQALSSYVQQGGSMDDAIKAMRAGNKNFKVDVDSFIQQYRPEGAVTLSKPAAAKPAAATPATAPAMSMRDRLNG
jgi:hypothetical protein